MHNDIDVESSGKKTKITFGNEEEGSYLFAGFLKGIEAKDSTSALMGVKNSLSVALSSSASASAAGRGSRSAARVAGGQARQTAATR